jgi:hypothetical protein
MRKPAPFGQMLAAVALAAMLISAVPHFASAQEKKEYLTDSEADKIREAMTPSERIKLYMDFADDRIKKLKYTLAHPSSFDKNRSEELNGLINAYSGCVDDAADQVGLAHEKQQDIRAGAKVLKAKTQEFLGYLQVLDKSGPELDTYKDTLDDAVEATQDALQDATKAEKDNSTPIRRKQ